MTGTRLETCINRFADPDQAYRILIDAHRGLGDAASAALNARLVLILANQLGDVALLAEAVALARSSADDPLRNAAALTPARAS